MPRLVITIVLAFLLERATSQEVPSACMNATNQYNTSCAGVDGFAVCTGECGNATRAFISACPEVSLINLLWGLLLIVAHSYGYLLSSCGIDNEYLPNQFRTSYMGRKMMQLSVARPVHAACSDMMF